MSGHGDGRHRKFGALLINPTARSVTLAGSTVALTPTELAILLALTSVPRRAVPNDELLRAMWGSAWLPDTAALHIHVSRLRRKLGESGSRPRRIITLHGLGYRFEPDGPDPGEQSLTSDLPPTSAEANILVSVERIIAWASEGMGSLLGRAPGDLVGLSVYDLVHPADAARWRTARTRLDSGHPAALTGRLRTADGTYVDIQATARPLLAAAGAVVGFLGTFRAASGAARPDEPIEPIELERTSATGAMGVTELIYDERFVLCAIFPPMTFLGWHPSEILGTEYSPTGMSPDLLRAMVHQLIAMGQRDMGGAVQLRMRDGSSIGAHVTSHVVIDPLGAFEGLHSIVRLPGVGVTADQRSAGDASGAPSTGTLTPRNSAISPSTRTGKA